MSAQILMADRAPAQTSARLDANAVWREPAPAKAASCESSADDKSRQLVCVIGIMRASGATRQAIAFVRRCSAQIDEICFLSNYQAFGPISLATLALPLLRNTNAHSDIEYALANGRPSFIRIDDNDAVHAALSRNPFWQRLERKYPNIDIWEGTVYTGAHGRPGGGYRFLFSYPLGTYHAEAGRWNASIAFDFAPDGTFAGRKTVGITGPRR